MSDFDGFGEEYRFLIDVDFTSGGVWGTANWEQLAGTPKIDRTKGIVSAEFVDRAKQQKAWRRSKVRSPELVVDAYVQPGNAAFDRLDEASEDATNDGTEILHIMVVEGDPEVAGNRFWEYDVVITDEPAATSEFGEGAMISYTLKLAADSVNTPVKGFTT